MCAARLHQAFCIGSAFAALTSEYPAILGRILTLFYLGQAGRLTEAERLLKTMRKSKCPRGSAAYVTLMEAYGREEEPEEAERIFLLMQVDGKGLNPSSPKQSVL
jgi:pentatricopeptide repeat protein